MATFRKRGRTWRVEVCKNGIRDSASFDTKSQAKEWASTTETQIIARKLNPFACNKTLGDAFDRYATEVSPNKKGERWKKFDSMFLNVTPYQKRNYQNYLQPILLYGVTNA